MSSEQSSAEIAELIRRCFLFADAGEEAIARLAATSIILRRGGGETLFFEGDEGDAVYIIESGLVRIWMSEPENGKELTLAYLEEGDVFGEIAMLDGGLRTASASVVEDARLLEIKRKAVFDAVREAPNFAEHLIGLLCERFRSNTQDLNAVALQSLKRRLAQKLCALAMAHGHIEGARVRFSRKFSQSELAQLLGATREAVNRHLSEWSKDGVVKVEAGRLEILDLPKLRSAQF